MTDTGIPMRPGRREERGPTGRIVKASADTGEADVTALARERAERVAGEVRFSDGERALYATDASNDRQVPIGVVLPQSAEDVVAPVALCRRHGVPVLSRGGGTSLAGQGCTAAVVIDFSRHLDRVAAIDPERRLARVEPGCILDVLRAEAERHGPTFGPDPATHDRCTLGGRIGNDSCGVPSVVGRRTADNAVALEVLADDGARMTVGATDGAARAEIRTAGGRRAEIVRALQAFRDRYGEALRHGFPDIPRRVSGYADLDALLPENGFDRARALVGTEGTCVIALSATVRLIPSPPDRSLCLLGFEDVFSAADAVPEGRGHDPLAIEGIDRFLVEAMHAVHLHEDKLGLLPPGRAWRVVEFCGDTGEEAEAPARLPRRPTSSSGRDTTWFCRRPGCAAAARSKRRGCSTRRRRCGCAPSTRSRGRSRSQRPSSPWSRPAPPPSGTSSSTSSRRIRPHASCPPRPATSRTS